MVHLEQFRAKWGHKQSVHELHKEIRVRAEKRVIQDARRAEIKLAGSQPKEVTRQR
jgi:hypothetical protein